MAGEMTMNRGHELHALRSHWWCFLVMGIALVIFGTLAIGAPALAGTAAVAVFGFLLMAAGVTQVVTSFWSGKWSGMLLHMLIGILYMVVGFMIVDEPVSNMIMITKLIAFFLIVTGIFEVVAALAHRFHSWGWVLLNGGITLLLGILILKQWPSSGTWVIGLYVGIEMIFNGWGWIMLSIGLKSSTQPATSAL